MGQPVQEVVEILGADLADGRTDAKIPTEQAHITGKSFHGVDGETFVLHVPFECAEGGLQGSFTGQDSDPRLVAFLGKRTAEKFTLFGDVGRHDPLQDRYAKL